MASLSDILRVWSGMVADYNQLRLNYKNYLKNVDKDIPALGTEFYYVSARLNLPIAWAGVKVPYYNYYSDAAAGRNIAGYLTNDNVTPTLLKESPVYFSDTAITAKFCNASQKSGQMTPVQQWVIDTYPHYFNIVIGTKTYIVKNHPSLSAQIVCLKGYDFVQTIGPVYTLQKELKQTMAQLQATHNSIVTSLNRVTRPEVATVLRQLREYNLQLIGFLQNREEYKVYVSNQTAVGLPIVPIVVWGIVAIAGIWGVTSVIKNITDRVAEQKALRLTNTRIQDLHNQLLAVEANPNITPEVKQQMRNQLNKEIDAATNDLKNLNEGVSNKEGALDKIANLGVTLGIVFALVQAFKN